MNSMIKTNKPVVQVADKSLTKWVWKTSDNRRLSPSNMDTNHLFNTLKMIWNHFMPTEFRITPFKQYSYFSSFYTREYLGEAIQKIGKELLNRDDLTPSQKDQLQYMWDCLYKNRVGLELKLIS